MSQIVVNKTNLNFLNIFNVCVSNTDSMANKINFFTKDGKLYLTQYSDSINLVHIIKGNYDIDFNVWYETGFIFNFIKSVPDKMDIIFSEEDGIKLGNNSWYKPKTFQYDNRNFDLIQALISDGNIKKYNLTDLDKIGKAKSFIGNPFTKDFDCIRADNGNFTTSYADDKVSVILKNNIKNLNESFFIDKTIYNVVKLMGLDEINISYLIDKKYYMFAIENEFFMFYPEKRYEIPNLNEDQFKSLYFHSDIICVDRKYLLEVLNRLNLITSKDYQNRIYFNLSKGSVEIECKDGAEAKENIPASISDNLVGHTFILSSTFVQQILSVLIEDKINIRASKENTIAVSFTNSENEEDIFIHCTYSNIPSV